MQTLGGGLLTLFAAGFVQNVAMISMAGTLLGRRGRRIPRTGHGRPDARRLRDAPGADRVRRPHRAHRLSADHQRLWPPSASSSPSSSGSGGAPACGSTGHCRRAPRPSRSACEGVRPRPEFRPQPPVRREIQHGDQGRSHRARRPPLRGVRRALPGPRLHRADPDEAPRRLRRVPASRRKPADLRDPSGRRRGEHRRQPHRLPGGRRRRRAPGARRAGRGHLRARLRPRDRADRTSTSAIPTAGACRSSTPGGVPRTRRRRARTDTDRRRFACVTSRRERPPTDRRGPRAARRWWPRGGGRGHAGWPPRRR